jgi:hypothetical protein
MSEATIFEFPYNLFIKQRLEFVVICHDQIAAAIMRIVECEMIKQKEAWQNKVTTAVEAKKTPPKEPAEYWVRLSHGQIIAKLYYYDSGKLEKPGEEATEQEIKEYLRKKGISLSKTTIRRTINQLIDLGLLLMRSKPGDEFGAPLYTLHRKNVQKALKSLPANPFSIFNQWEGVSNLEGGVSKLESGELAESEEGVSNLESGEFPNWKVNKDNKEISSKIPKDNLKEDTCVTASADDTTTTSSFANGEDDATRNHPTTYHHSVGSLDSMVPDRDLPSLTEDTHGTTHPQPETEQPTTSVEIAENNRLTNPPEPLTENISSTDESSSRIERETANDTASSPVIEPATDGVIHTGTRNTTNSYSPKSTATSTPETEPVTEQAEPPATGKGSGKRGNKKPSPTQEQIRKVFDTINEVFRKLHPETPDFKVVESEKATKAVKSLIDAKASPALVKLVMFDMWNEMDSRGEHWWRKRGRMTVPAICEQYTSRAPGLASKLPNHAATKNEVVKDSLAENTSPKPPVVVSSSPLGAYSSRPELQPWKDDGAVSDEALNRPSWAAIKKQRKQAAGGR